MVQAVVPQVVTLVNDLVERFPIDRGVRNAEALGHGDPIDEKCGLKM